MISKEFHKFAVAQKLTLTQISVFAAVVELAKGPDEIASCPLVRIAERALVTTRTLNVVIDALIAKGLLTRTAEGLHAHYRLRSQFLQEPRNRRHLPTTYQEPAQFPKFPQREEDRYRRDYGDKQDARAVEATPEHADEVVVPPTPDREVRMVSDYDRCYGASKEVHRQWLVARKAGHRNTLEQFTDLWVMAGEEMPDESNPVLWGMYIQEREYRKGLLYK